MELLSEPLILRVPDLCRLLRWNEGQLYMAVRRGQIPARKMGRRVVFLRREIETYLMSLPPVSGETVISPSVEVTV